MKNGKKIILKKDDLKRKYLYKLTSENYGFKVNFDFDSLSSNITSISYNVMC